MYIKDKWLSDQFGYSVYNIKSLNSKTIDNIDKINKNNLIIYKTKNIKNKKILLQKNKFKLIENTILFSFNIKKNITLIQIVGFPKIPIKKNWLIYQKNLL